MSGCHQILTGAVNPGDRSFSLGNIDGIAFLAYASGCNIVILSFDFQRVQIIPGNVQISCVHCSPELGKIAAAYQNKIKIFEPIIVNQDQNSLFNYRWRETSTLECDCRVNSLSWDQEGSRLLMGGTSLQMWKISRKIVAKDEHVSQVFWEWESIWKCSTATEIHYLSFSPDSCLFATAGKFDRLVKIWYPITRYTIKSEQINFDFVYLAHPRAVTGFGWRQTSKYMPKGAVFNALITSCLDKICRIWTETVLPEDGFSINVNRDLQPTDPKFHRTHKHRIIKRLQHVKACFHLKKHRHKDQIPTIASGIPLPFPSGSTIPMISGGNYINTIPNNMDFLHTNSISIHFHLAGSINAETDIPLVPPHKNHNFRIFWLNNKEMFFTHQAEAILQELCKRGLDKEDTMDNLNEDDSNKPAASHDGDSPVDDNSHQSLSSGASSGSLAEMGICGNYIPSIDIFDRKLEALLRDWHRTPDILVSLHPIDGSFLVWSIEWLDEFTPGSFRQSQISFSSCIPGAIPLADATSMSSPNLFLFPLEKLASNRAAMMTKHHNGSLNLWTLSFGDDSKFCQVLSVSHAKRASGHRFQVREMACHPVLPLILTAASHGDKPIEHDSNPAFVPEPGLKNDNKHHLQIQNYCSELILWRVDPIGPLCKSGGIVEVARINSTELDAFSHVAWVPGLFPSTTLFSNSGCFVASDGCNLRVYQAVLDASNLLAEITTAYRKRKASLNDSVISLSSSSSMSSLNDREIDEPDPDLFAIVSQQSTSRPGCILQLDKIDSQDWGEISFIQVFRDDLDPVSRGILDYRESFHIVLIQNKNQVHVWRMEVSTPLNTMYGNSTEDVFAQSFSQNPSSEPNGDITIDVSKTQGNTQFNDNSGKKSFLNISISKIVEQTLFLETPDISYSSCSGHIVCGSSYALISTTNEHVKLWKLRRNQNSNIANTGKSERLDQVSFQEWNTLKSCKEKGTLIQASAAYSGRIACVYRLNKINIDNSQNECTCAVVIYECESTGGTEWGLEDTIELKVDEEIVAVHLEWVPKHDAQHILALAISDMVCLFAHISQEPSVTFGTKSLPFAKDCKSQFWLPLHVFKLSSADGLRPFPVRFNWIHAVCVVAMRNEMQVYSQWALENLTDMNSLITPVSQSKQQTTEEQLRKKTNFELSLLSGSVGLFQYTRHCYPVLPQYHPTQLMEMLNSGKVRWVKVILAHLVRCLGGSTTATLKRQNSLQGEAGQDDMSSRNFSRSRGLSVSYGPTPPSPLEHRNSAIFQLEELNVSNSSARLAPIPLWMLMQADKETGHQMPVSEEKSRDYNELFSLETMDEPMDESVFEDNTEDEDGIGSGNSRPRRRSTSGDNQPLAFGQRQSRMLSRVLTHTQLPGLTSLDQMHLLALADTVAAIGTRLDQHADVTTKTTPHDGTPDSLDDCGLRFLLVVKHYSYLCRCLPPAQRIQLQKSGISTADVVWAFHSESQEDILTLIPSYQKGEMNWPQMRELGLGYWLRNNTTLRQCMEKVAKWAYQKVNDPMDAAIFYLAMKKKTLLWGLYRSKKDEKMSSFFSNDFTQERWRKAALKNAYALLGKQRFDHAAGFFLLAGSLKDAVEVCLSKLNDIQLALVIARLYDGGDMEPTPNSVKTLLKEEIIESKSNEETDPFLRSMALWMLKDYQASLDTLLESSSVSSRVFNFYVYLRTHPLLVRQNKTRGALALSPIERNLYYQTAHSHYASGCPALAIHVLTQLPKIIEINSKKNSIVTSPTIKDYDSKKIESGTFEGHLWDSSSNFNDISNSSPKKIESGIDVDWSAPISNRFEDELKLDWDDDAKDDDEEEEVKEAIKPKIKEEPKISFSQSVEDVEGDEDLNNPHTMISVELKLASCLKLMSEELNNMAGQIEGTELRLHLYFWLEKQVPLLKELCKYKSDDDESIDDWANTRESRSLTPRLDTHDLLISEKLDLEWKMGVLSRRSRWLRANRHLLVTLLGFARLHAHSLAPVHIELIFLLDELQKEKSSGTAPSLVSPLPLLNSEFPLLSAVANPNKAAVSYIQASARDILNVVSEFIAIPVYKNNTPEEMPKVEETIEQNDDENEEEERPNEEENEEKDENENLNIDEYDNIEKVKKKDRDSISQRDPKREELSVTVCDWRVILVLRDSGISLSSCLFQALSDSEGAENMKDVGVQLLYTPRRRRWSSSGNDTSSGEKIISTPDKWPGVAILRGMLSREEDGETPRLKYLLVECYAAIYVSILIHAIAICDTKTIYKLLGKKIDANAFSAIFGGGAKKQIKLSTLQQLNPQSVSDKDGDTSPSSVWTTLASLNKARMKFNMKLLGQQFTLSQSQKTTTPSKEEKSPCREKFVPPDIAIYSYLMSKPKARSDESEGKLIFLDSDDEEEDLVDDQEEEDDDDFWDNKESSKKKSENSEDEPFSYSWRIMRLAIVKLAKAELKRIVTIVGIDFNDLSHISPYLDGIIRVFSVWQDRLYKELEEVAPAPPNFLINSTVENLSGPPINKYRALLDHTNTPFSQKKITFGLRRLWNFLVREEIVQDYFVRFVFGKRRPEDSISLWSEMGIDGRHKRESDKDGGGGDYDEDDAIPIGPVRIVHKEHESISSFCINQANAAFMAISTPKEIQELDVGLLLDMESWKFEDQFEFDLINLYKDPEALSASSYLVVQSPSDKSLVTHLDKPQKGSHSLIKGVNFVGCTNPTFVQYVHDRSRRFMVPILKHRVDGTRRMTSHSSLPLYLAGGQDGSVRLWEFSHAQPVSIPRNAGTFAKVTKMRFYGSKFGVSDGDGRLSLYQIGANPRPFYTVQCHSKQTSDFVFLGSSSLIASAGTSSDNKNVAMWDTLMPSRKAQIAAFTSHEQGCVALAYAEEHQCLISAGKKGAIFFWDVRQRSLRHRFQGHDGAIKCMCLDPSEEFFCTGSADGDIKVWDFSGKSRGVFCGEHSRSGFFIPGQGVTQLSIDSSRRLYSCGADGSLKIRVIADKFD